MYWEESDDVHNILVSEAMRRNRFLEILRFLHFCDNADLDVQDKCSKIRPLLSMIQERFQRYAFETETVNVDESMIEYFGKYGNRLKQRIPSKPIRSGYKVWSLNMKDGYLHSFDVYQGKGSQTEFQDEFGLGPGVVLGLIKNIISKHYQVYIDNYFTSVKLLTHLAEMEIGCTGTFNKKMLSNCPLPPDREMLDQGRGSHASFVHDKYIVQLTKWFDNKCVVIGSNFMRATPLGECQRWSSQKKEFIKVPRPQSIEAYNESMGGTDAMDQSINCYKPTIRNRKWYFPIFVFLMMSSAYNGWKLARRFGYSGSFLNFIRYIVKSYLVSLKTKRKRTGKTNALYGTSKIAKRVPESLRYDGSGHYIGTGTSRTRCALCGRHTTKYCVKCEVKVHTECFAPFHGHVE